VTTQEKNMWSVYLFVSGEGKPFVATLAYYSGNMDEKSREELRQIVKLVTMKFKEKDYKYFDDHETYEQGCKTCFQTIHIFLPAYNEKCMNAS